MASVPCIASFLGIRSKTRLLSDHPAPPSKTTPCPSYDPQPHAAAPTHQSSQSTTPCKFLMLIVLPDDRIVVWVAKKYDFAGIVFCARPSCSFHMLFRDVSYTNKFYYCEQMKQGCVIRQLLCRGIRGAASKKAFEKGLRRSHRELERWLEATCSTAAIPAHRTNMCEFVSSQAIDAR